MGWARACEIGFLADDIGAPTRALELGLVNAVVPAAELMAETMRWAGKIAANAPLAVRAIKRLYRHGLSEDFAVALAPRADAAHAALPLAGLPGRHAGVPGAAAAAIHGPLSAVRRRFVIGRAFEKASARSAR